MKFDKLFTAGEDWHNNACLNWKADHSDCYILGYRHAADLLVRDIDEKANFQDILVYPIIFLYRQYLELLLKDLIRLSRILLKQSESHPYHHNLHNLWLLAEELLFKLWPNEEAPEFDFIDNIIFEFYDADPNSFSFRYEKDRKGKRNVSTIKHINVRHFSEIINKAGDILESVQASLENRIDLQSDNF